MPHGYGRILVAKLFLEVHFDEESWDFELFTF